MGRAWLDPSNDQERFSNLLMRTQARKLKIDVEQHPFVQ